MVQVKSALLNKTGLTLVEVMIALVVLLFVSLALMQTALVSISANTRNSVRDAVASVAEARLNQARDIPLANLVADTADTVTDDNFNISASAPQDWQACSCKAGEGCDTLVGLNRYDIGPYPVKEERDIRNLQVKFGTRRLVSTLDSTTKQVTVVVRAVYNNTCYSQVSTTVVR